MRRLALLLLPLLVACGQTSASPEVTRPEPAGALSSAEATALLAALPQVAARELAALGRVRLSWNADELTLLMGGERVSGPRNEADSGMYARIPDEPAGLFEVVAAASDVEVEGREEVAGVATTHLRGTAQPRAAVEAGLGTQAQLAIAQLPELPVEVWIDDLGRPARIRYAVALPSLQEGRTRSIVTTYDYRGWGEPVDVTP